MLKLICEEAFALSGKDNDMKGGQYSWLRSREKSIAGPEVRQRAAAHAAAQAEAAGEMA